MSVASIAVYGIVLAGWSSNNKYAMLGGLRSTAQMISYELALGLSFIGPILLADSMSLSDIVEKQRSLLVHRVQPIGVADLSDHHPGRGQPRAVRHARGRAGADRRLPHRILRHEVRAVLHGRIHQDDRRQRHRRHACSWAGTGGASSSTGCRCSGLFTCSLKVVVLLFFMIWVRATCRACATTG